jgi:HK97 family phage prohead protease
MEHKFTSLKTLKMTDQGSGSIEGYRSVAGVIDEIGDIVVRGAFADSHDEYMQSGFSAESHDWTFKDVIGYPVQAYEDSMGWFVKSQFHSTTAAQTVRTIAKERLAAGKQVGFSFGYKTDEYEYIQPADYPSKLPQYLKPDRLSENLAKAQRFSQIRILKKVSAIEDSIVTAPMNKLAGATAVKSGQRCTKSMASIRADSIKIRIRVMEAMYLEDPRVEGRRICMQAEKTIREWEALRFQRLIRELYQV